MRGEWQTALQTGAKLGREYALALVGGAGGAGKGAQLGKRAGSSLEFLEHRAYHEGDDLRNLDWNVYARTCELTVKHFREEIPLQLELIVDGSASMAAKAESVLLTTALLAGAAESAGFVPQVRLANRELEPVPGRTAAGLAEWENWRFEGGCDWERLLNAPTGSGNRATGVRILLSDLLTPVPPEAVLRPLRNPAAAAAVIRISAPEERTPEWRGNLRLVDCESGDFAEIFLDEAGMRRYHERLTAHREAWSRACREHGVCLAELDSAAVLRRHDLMPLLTARLLRPARGRA